jgi:hypothetical protein
VIQDSLAQIELVDVNKDETTSTSPTGNELMNGFVLHLILINTCLTGVGSLEPKAQVNGKSRRPDKQIYVPKAQREKNESATTIDAKWIGSRIVDKTTSIDNTAEFQPEEDPIWTKLVLHHFTDVN